MKIHGIIYGMLALSAAAFCSCAGKSSGESGDSDTFSAEMPAMDTTPEDTIKKDDGTPYISLKSYEAVMDFIARSGHAERYRSGIIPRIAAENVEYAEKLLNNVHPRFIIVDKGSMNVIVYDKYGVEEVHYGMACARNYGTKHKKADSRTPEGFFTAEGIYNSTDWLFTDDWGHTSPAKGVFGPRFIRLKTKVTSQIGIHGTSSPGSIGRRTSHGCIRVTNENIMKLVKMVEPGMPIIVSPGPADQVVNEREGVKIYAVNTGYEPMKHTAPPAKPAKPKQELKETNESEQGAGQGNPAESEAVENPSGEQKEEPAATPAQTPETPVQSQGTSE